VRSLLVLGAAAAVFVLYLVRNERQAEAHVRAEDAAIERIAELVQGPPGPPRVEAGYRFRWIEGGELPPVLVGSPDGGPGVCLFAATPGAVYAYEVFDEPPPDVTPIRVLVAKKAEGAPPGWRKVR
jgi:hypothetical protein